MDVLVTEESLDGREGLSIATATFDVPPIDDVRVMSTTRDETPSIVHDTKSLSASNGLFSQSDIPVYTKAEVEFTREKRNSIRSLERAKEDEIETLRKRIEDLQLNAERAQLALCKRKREDLIVELYRQQGVERTETLLLVRLDDCRRLYSFRRQVRALVPALYRRRDIHSFVCLFLTDNAVQDYNSCKNAVLSMDKSIHISRNSIELAEDCGVACEDVEATILQILNSRYLIRADVCLDRLRRLFQLESTTVDANVDANDASPFASLFNDVNRLFEAAYYKMVDTQQQRASSNGE